MPEHAHVAVSVRQCMCPREPVSTQQARSTPQQATMLVYGALDPQTLYPYKCMIKRLRKYNCKRGWAPQQHRKGTKATKAYINQIKNRKSWGEIMA